MMPITESERDAWADALESGKYPQGLSALRNTSGYCCLGVLAEVLGGVWSRELCAWRSSYNNTLQDTNRGEYLKYDILPRAIQLDFAMINDKGVPFSDVAKVIRNKTLSELNKDVWVKD